MSIVRLSFTLILFFLSINIFIPHRAISKENSIEIVVRNLLRSINNNDYEAILNLIPEEGVIDGNTKISKEEIKNDLINKNSYLYSHLYKTVTPPDIERCIEKLNGKLIVSPYAFYAFYGENYEVNVSPLEKFNNVFNVHVVGKSTKENNGCKFELWYLIIQEKSNSYYLGSYFFH